MQNKRILLASWTFYPAWSYGGIARAMYELALMYAKDGYTVDVVTSDVFDNDSRHSKTFENINGVNIRYFRNLSNWAANQLKFPLPIGLSDWLRENIRSYDIVHIADFRNPFNFLVYRYCRKYGVPYVVSPFGTVPYELDAKFPIKKLFDLLWSKRMLIDAKYVTVQTQSEFEQLVQFGTDPKKTKIIPLMVDFEKFSKLPNPGIIRSKFGIPTDSKVLLFVGRIHEYKATKMMLDCFADYEKSFP